MKASFYIFLIMAGVIAFLLWRLNRVAAARDSANSALTEKSDSIRYFRSESGKIVAEKAAAEISQQDFERHYADLAKVLQADFRIRIKQAVAVLQAEIQANGAGVVMVVRDTVRLPGAVPVVRDSFTIDDGYLQLGGRLVPGQKVKYSYQYGDSLIFAADRRKKWLYGKETLYGSVRLSNPNARALRQTAIFIDERRQKRWGLSVGAYYDPFRNQWGPSVNVGYTLIRL